MNVLGAINPLNQKLLTVVNEDYINAESVCELLRMIREAHPDRSVPLKLVMDNARYQRCKRVEAQEKALAIEIVFLPPYSPHFNLIERLWKFVKKQSLNNCYYETFEAFKSGINACLEGIDKKYRSQVETLMTLRFQTFRNDQIMAG